MAQEGSNRSAPKRLPSKNERRVVSGDALCMKILAVVDGSERTGRIVKWLLDLPLKREAIEVVLLNIQPKPQEWRMRGYGWFQREAIHDRLINDLGARIAGSVARHLKAAGIAHRSRVVLGDVPEIIVRCTEEENCDLVVVPQPEPGTIRRWLMRAARLTIGSDASAVVHSVQVPVVLVR
jgi:nucleotide-binding universal stress UspA family protein